MILAGSSCGGLKTDGSVGLASVLCEAPGPSRLRPALAVGRRRCSNQDNRAFYRRVAEDAITAEAAGADVVLVTCSLISPCVDVAQNMVSIPVLKIDEPMADRAVDTGTSVGVAATATTTLKPTTELIKARARVAGKSVQVDAVLCEGAFDVLMSGDTEGHDRIVKEHLYRMMESNDVIVLAQASMARCHIHCLAL